MKKVSLVTFTMLLSILFTYSAFAQPTSGFSQDSEVHSLVTNPNGTYSYAYTVFNKSDGPTRNGGGIISGQDGPMIVTNVIVDWELPFLDDAQITDIIAPTGWTWTIEEIGVPNIATLWDGVAAWQTPGDPFYVSGSIFNTVTKVLHWYVEDPVFEVVLDEAIFPGESLGGFGFISPYSETDAPYQASWWELPIQTGDPAFPLGGLPFSPTLQGNVPEPTSLLLLGSAVIGLMRWFKSRK